MFFMTLTNLAGLPQGQKKSGNQKNSGKTKKNDISHVKMGFLKKVRKSQEKNV